MASRNTRDWTLDLRILTTAGIELAPPPDRHDRARIATDTLADLDVDDTTPPPPAVPESTTVPAPRAGPEPCAAPAPTAAASVPTDGDDGSAGAAATGWRSRR